jgi:hypothetical protein
MQKEFIPYEQAIALKELGFDEPCFGYRDGVGHLMIKSMPHCAISAPTFSQAFRWFRENHNLFSSEVYDRGLNTGEIPIIHSYSFRIKNLNNFQDFYGDIFDTYEEAELTCLKKLIEIVKQKTYDTSI